MFRAAAILGYSLCAFGAVAATLLADKIHRGDQGET